VRSEPLLSRQHTFLGKFSYEKGAYRRFSFLNGRLPIMTKTGRPSSPGSVARGQSFYRRSEISRCRQCNGQPISQCKWAGGSTRIRPAASGWCRAICTSSSIIRGRKTRVVRCTRIARSVCSPCSSRTCARSVASAKPTLPGYLGFFQLLRSFRAQNAFERAELILWAALDPAI
jgi:hypothetical protein